MPINLEEFKRTIEEQNKRGNTGYFKPGEGETRIRILPSWDALNPNSIYKKASKHSILGEMYVCPKDTIGQPCPICDQYWRLWRSGKTKPEDEALAKEIRPVQRYYWNIIVRGQESKGVQKWNCGQKLANKITNIITAELNKDITDPVHGHDLVIIRKSIGGDYPDYSSSYVVRDESPLGNMEWLNQLTNFDKEFVCLSYDELRKVVENRLGPNTVSLPPTSVSAAPPVQPTFATPTPIPTPVTQAPVQAVSPSAPQPQTATPPVQAVPPVDTVAKKQHFETSDILSLIKPK